MNTGSRRSDAETILRTNGADVGENIAQGPAGEPTATEPAMERQRMELYGEMLRIHRDRVQRGEVAADERNRERGRDRERNAA